MKKFNTFLLEGKKLLFGTKIINEDELLHLSETDYSDFNFYDTEINRVVDNLSQKKIYIDNPNERDRYSVHNSNFYNLLIDYSLNLPKRSKSLIAKVQGTYLNKEYQKFRLIPKNNAIFGVCDTSDVWYSDLDFGNFVIDFQYFAFLCRDIFRNIPNIDKDIEIFKSNINLKFKNPFTPSSMDYEKTKLLHNYLKKNSEENNSTFFDELVKVFQKLNFQKMNYKELIKYNSETSNYPEVWTDSECVLMNYTQTKDLCVSRFTDFSNENASPYFCLESDFCPRNRLKYFKYFLLL